MVQVKHELSEHFAKVRVVTDGTVQFREIKRVRGYMSALEPVAHFGIGSSTQVDTLEVFFAPDRHWLATNIPANQRLTVSVEQAKPYAAPKRGSQNRYFRPVSPLALQLDFQHVENDFDDFSDEILLPYKQSTMGPMTSQGDFNGDGLEDLFIGGAAGQSGQVFLQEEQGSFRDATSLAISNDAQYEDLESVALDVDGDEDLDLVVISGGNAKPANQNGYAHRLYRNDGTGKFVKSRLAGISQNSSGKSVAAIDIENDGDLDIIIGNRIVPQKYPLAAASYILVNDGGTFRDRTSEIAPHLSSVGIVNDILCTDIDGDGWMDFITVGEWEGINIHRNQGGVFSPPPDDDPLHQLTGWWFSIHETDINKDGLSDFVVGNVGENIKFETNTDQPFKVFANDFDHTGTLDVVLSNVYHGDYVPVRGRECSSQQMAMITDKFETYDAFANATIEDIYGRDLLEDAYQKSVSTFSSVLLLNRGNMNFEVRKLPAEAQVFPLLDVVFHDLDQDGFDDAILSGCIYNTEVETPRLDAGSGLALLSDRADGYRVAPCPRYCMHIPGNVKSLTKMSLAQGKQILIGLANNGPMTIFELR